MAWVFNIWDISDAPGDGESHTSGGIDNDLESGPELNIGNREPVTQKRTTKNRKRKAGTDRRSAGAKRTAISKVNSEDPEHKIIAAVDFGQTYSGYAYRSTLESTDRDIRVGVDYPGAAKVGQNLEKAPTAIAYAAQNKDYGLERKSLLHDRFGYEVEAGMNQVREFKLLLDEHTNLTEDDDQLLDLTSHQNTASLPPNKTAVDVSGDYLKFVYQEMMGKIERAYGKELLARTPIDIHVTVPTVWKDQTIEKTRAAFKLAGFYSRNKTTLIFISEAEAAAVAALEHLTTCSWRPLKVGESIVVVDIGGGTIDAGCFSVKNLVPIELRPVTIDEGSKSGATAIDRRFLEQMRDWFGEAFTSMPIVRWGLGSKFMNLFENSKKAFRSDSDDNIRIDCVPLGQSLSERGIKHPNFDGEENEVLLSGKTMMGFFGHTVDRTCEIIQNQVTSAGAKQGFLPKFVVLAGGLAASEYLYQQVKAFCDEKFGDKIILVKPENAWSAIARGAVQYGMSRSVITSRIARRHYGIVAGRHFREGVDPEERSFICPRHGKRLGGELKILLHKGQVTPKKPYCIRGFVVLANLRLNEMQREWHVFCSEADQVPRWHDDPDVHHIGHLKIDLREISKAKIKKGYSDANADPGGKPITVKLNITVSGGHSAGTFHIKASAEHRNVGNLVLSLA